MTPVASLLASGLSVPLLEDSSSLPHAVATTARSTTIATPRRRPCRFIILTRSFPLLVSLDSVRRRTPRCSGATVDDSCWEHAHVPGLQLLVARAPCSRSPGAPCTDAPECRSPGAVPYSRPRALSSSYYLSAT